MYVSMWWNADTPTTSINIHQIVPDTIKARLGVI